ncbi:uncharacterized protein [Channa argus]|uniref:uncharacterized protein isoform X2 n=1 Tax=Channa argus TaxID=215402 RepID=UPI00351F8C44
MPEAAVDIARILQLLSAMEKGCLEKFEGKSLEEIEIEDELQPDLEYDKPDGDDDNEDDEEAESSVQSSGPSSSRRSVSSTKKKGFSMRKLGRPRTRRPESGSEESEPCDERNDENTPKEDRTEDMPVEKAEETLSPSKQNATSIYFSEDDDNYMNVDFDLDIDTDEGGGKYESDKDCDSVGLALMPVKTSVKETPNQNKDISDNKTKDSSSHKHNMDTELKETMDVEAENDVDQEEEQTDRMDVDSSSSSAILDADELRPDLEYDKPDGDNEDNEKAASSVQSSGPSSSRCSVLSTKKEGLSMRKRGRPRTRRLESRSEESEPCDEENDESTLKEDKTEDMPVKKAEETLFPSKEDATKVYFNDDDDNDDDDYMNVDVYSDIDADDGDGKYENDKEFSSEQAFIDDSSIQQENKEANLDENPSYTNRNHCYVCGKAQSKLARHLFTHRKQEAEIAEVFALPRCSNERKIRLQKLRNRGNDKHNQEVLKTGRGELKVRKRKNLPTLSRSCAPCIYCKGMYDRREMWQHLQKCLVRKSQKPPTATNNENSSLVATTVTTPQEISADVKEILKTLKNDEISSAVWNDSYILHLAQYLCQMKAKKIKHKDLKRKLRDMGRLLVALRKKSICSFEEALKPKNFSKVVEAVREVSGFNGETNSSDRSAAFLRLGRSLRKMGNMKYHRALKEDADLATIQEAETFMALCAKEWMAAPLSKLKANTAPNIPFTHDVQLFYQYLETTAASAVSSLTMYESAPVYIALLRVTVALVSVLNKSASDVSRITLQSFNEREETELQEDAAVVQSHFEQILCKRFMKIKLMSKCGKKAESKKVVVTLTPELLNAITLLVHKREACGVHKNNPFLFARPVNICTSFFQGHVCINTLVPRCGAKNLENLRSQFFRKHMAKIFQILSLTNDELGHLAKLLGRDMRTDREYYQMPEAAVDIARILQLLSAMEKGCLEKFEGKSLEEIEIEDELQPDVEFDKPDGDDDKEGNEEAESSVQSGGPSSSRRSVSSTKKKGFSMRKRGRPRTRRPESGSEESEPCDERNDENTPKEDRTEDMPVKKAEETLSPSKENATSIYFSDDDDDNYMNMDFDLDIDTDEGGGNYESDKDGDSVGLALMPVKTSVKETANQNKDISDNKMKDSSSHKHNTYTELKETMDVEAENDVDQEEEQTDRMDVDSSSSSAILDAEKKNKLSAAMTGMKELKILIPKLEIENIQGPIHISRLPSVCRRLLGKDQPLQKSSNKYEMSSPSADIDNKSSDAKDIEMMCSFCKKPMMKGQTAYQKKGFKDVFCSKNCLFEMFPMNRQTTKTCHYCLRSITQLLDLIMAVVDTKGTMKDFCSVTCLTSYKSNTGSTQVAHLLCSMCNKSCPAACELTLKEAVHKFCSDSCLEDFRRDKMGVCENCSSPCLKKLVLKLEGEPKTICTERCLDHFKEILLQNIKTPQPCTMCHTTQPVPDMIVYKSSSETMELFCSRNCVTSYKLGSTLMHKLQGKTGSDQMKKTKRGITLEQTLNTEDVNIRSDYTSSCPAEKHPEIKLVTKSCYNCFRVIMRPHNIILAPVDDSGTMKELCSETCLASVNSKRSLAATKPLLPLGPHLECKMCNRYCYCKFRLMLGGIVHGLCSDTCLTNFRKVNIVPLLTCDVCSSIHLDRQFELKMDDSSKNICSEECLVKFKGKVTKPQLCLMCQTSHQMSDMVENKNQDGSLNFFCSNRCMMVYKASFLTVTEKRKPSCEQNDLEEVKPPPHFFIKEEPIDDEYNQKVTLSVSTLDIKSEPSVAKEDLKISSIFSLTGDSKPAAPTVTHEDVPASCSNCKNILMDGETVYQRKGHADVFCSTSCLLKFYQMKPVKKTCQFCLQVIPQPQDAIQALVDSNGATKDFCSQACLSAFNYKTMMSTKIPIVPVGSHSQCNMCSRYSISKHEFIQDDRVYKMCSEPCLNRFCNLNKLSICENCHYCCKNPLMLKVEHRTKKVCSAACLAQVKKKVKAHQPCAMCHTSKLVTEMIENKNSEEELELFCTSSCLMASKIQAISASGTALNCDNCGKLAVPACHLAMSNGSIRNFCTLTCAMAFKDAQKDRISATNSTGVPNQTQCDLFKTPEKLLCARCQRVIGSTPKVIQTKDKINFVCSLACSQEFKRVNNITGMCAFCKNERIITDTKRIDGKDCYFCSDGCKMLYRDKLEKSWGKHCCPCAYCHSISATVVTAKYDDKEERFCSDVCSSNFKMLFYCVAKCDACSQAGKLRQCLPMLGQVKHFCDLKCLLHFCNKKIQAVDTDSSPPRSSAAVDSPPVISNVISLASGLGRRPSASSGAAQHGSVPDIQTKVVGHASIQTVPKELKNKSMLCTPLVHNKGVCCTTQTVDAEAQTDTCLPKVLPVPVPVYVPLPMTMYSQYTPKPVGLPLPLPVPVFFPVTLGGPEAAVKERIQPETEEGKSGMETKLKERTGGEGGQEGREMVKEGKRQETQTLTDRCRGCSHDLEKEGFNNQEEICPQSSLKSQSLQHTSKESPPVSGVGVAFKPQPELSCPASPDSFSLPNPAPGPTLQILGKVNNKNKGAKLQQMPKAEHEASQEDSEVMSRKHQKLKSQSGIDAWKRWIRWRTSQTNRML